MVLDDGPVVLSPEQGSNDLLLLSLVEGGMRHSVIEAKYGVVSPS